MATAKGGVPIPDYNPILPPHSPFPVLYGAERATGGVLTPDDGGDTGPDWGGGFQLGGNEPADWTPG